MKRVDIRAEVAEWVARAREQRTVVEKSQMVGGIVTSHPIPDFEEKDWFLCAAYDAVGAAVQRATRDLTKEDDAVSAQLALFDLIPAMFPTERSGKPCYVPIEQVTPGELRTHARRVRAGSLGGLMYADQLDRYAAYLESKQPPAQPTA